MEIAREIRDREDSRILRRLNLREYRANLPALRNPVLPISAENHRGKLSYTFRLSNFAVRLQCRPRSPVPAVPKRSADAKCRSFPGALKLLEIGYNEAIGGSSMVRSDPVFSTAF